MGDRAVEDASVGVDVVPGVLSPPLGYELVGGALLSEGPIVEPPLAEVLSTFDGTVCPTVVDCVDCAQAPLTITTIVVSHDIKCLHDMGNTPQP